MIPFPEGFELQPEQINTETVEIGNKLCLCIGEFVAEDCSHHTINVWLKMTFLTKINIKYLMTLNSRESVDGTLGDLKAADLKSLFTHIDSVQGRTFECYSAVQWISHTGLSKETDAKMKQDSACSLNCRKLLLLLFQQEYFLRFLYLNLITFKYLVRMASTSSLWN